jgi:hypothetical protein
MASVKGCRVERRGGSTSRSAGGGRRVERAKDEEGDEALEIDISNEIERLIDTRREKQAERHTAKERDRKRERREREGEREKP